MKLVRVGGGKKLLRFWGLKENVEREDESKIWNKKGTYGKDKAGVDRGAQDVTALAFDDNGVTYVGTAIGFIFRFSEQVRNLPISPRISPSVSPSRWPSLTFSPPCAPPRTGD